MTQNKNASKSINKKMLYNMVMEKIKTFFRKLLYRAKHEWFDFYHVVLFSAVFMCLCWTYGAINAMTRNWELEKTLNEKQYTQQLKELEVQNLELENLYYSSEEYQELSARQKLNKKLSGEKLVYLPENSIAAQEKHKNNKEIIYREDSNLAEWLSFLFGI